MGAGQAEYRKSLERLSLPRFRSSSAGPFLVAIEGPNGAGKTTLCAALARALGAPSCLGTDEAWFTEDFKSRMIRDAEWYASAMFFLSGCFEQIRIVRGRAEPLIIMDRSLWSTLAVQAAANVERLEALIAMLRPIAPLLQIPQLTIVLEASYATCQSRIANKPARERALDELTAQLDFHGREQAFYQWLAGQVPNTVFLDADRAGPDEVAQKAMALLRQHRC